MNSTDMFIIGIIVAITVVDVAFVIWKVPTISNRMQHYSRRIAFLPYAWGILGGHFVGPDMQLVPYVAGITIILVAGTVITASHHLAREMSLDLPWWVAMVYMGIGASMGVVFWPQG